LIDRRRSYAALSVAAGEHMHLVRALSIEAAARHPKLRDLDGIIIGGGFSPRTIDAFLTVLSEKSGLRELPVVAHSGALPADRVYRLPNLEYVESDEPSALVDAALPLIRQHALAARLKRQL